MSSVAIQGRGNTKVLVSQDTYQFFTTSTNSKFSTSFPLLGKRSKILEEIEGYEWVTIEIYGRVDFSNGNVYSYYFDCATIPVECLKNILSEDISQSAIGNIKAYVSKRMYLLLTPSNAGTISIGTEEESGGSGNFNMYRKYKVYATN